VKALGSGMEEEGTSGRDQKGTMYEVRGLENREKQPGCSGRLWYAA
jgi:hypothetical protein